MSEPRPPRETVIRRRPPRSQIIEIPKDPAIPEIPSVRWHAKLFVLGLLVLVGAGTLLLATPLTTQDGDRTPLVDAFFTALSAVAVTGLVVVDTATHWNLFGQIIILILIQIGGLGFMVGAGIVFQIIRSNAGSLKQALILRDSGPTLSLQEAARLTKHIAVFTLAVEAVGWLVLTAKFSQDMSLPRAVWHGLFYAVSGFCNAGFDLAGNAESLTGYRESIVINVALIVLIQAGSLSFMVVSDLFRTRTWREFALDTKLVLTGNVMLILIGFVTMMVLEWNRGLGPIAPEFRPMAALFQSVSGRTAGFATIDFSVTDPVTQFVWLALMMVGGAAGSTAGGVKIATMFIVLVAIVSTVQGREEPQVFQRRIPMPVILRAMSVIAFFLLFHFAGTLLLAYTEFHMRETGRTFLSLLFETMSALATTGLSTGITPAMSTAGKLIVCVLMFVGRLGPLTLAYALQRRQSRHRYRVPAAQVRIG